MKEDFLALKAKFQARDGIVVAVKGKQSVSDADMSMNALNTEEYVVEFENEQ